MHGPTQAFARTTEKLVKFSTINQVNAFADIEWPDNVNEDQFWFSPQGLSIAGTEIENELCDEQILRLAKWECINAFSLNTTGERELINSVTQIMDELSLGETKEYLYHLINEENQHMWYFEKFCLRYAGKVYPNRNIALAKPDISRALNHFMTFARILLFEEIGHYFNILNSKDDTVQPFVRSINQAHYDDEARHITFGRRVLRELAKDALQSVRDFEYAASELCKTLTVNYNALFNPSMYRDAGLENPLILRTRLIEHPVRQDIYKNQILKSARKAFSGIGIELTFPGEIH